MEGSLPPLSWNDWLAPGSGERLEGALLWQPLDALEKHCHSLGPVNGTENKSNWSRLRQFLCKPLDNTITEKSSCGVCPQNWSLHENKCYWISKERQTWNKSKEDCTVKHSQLLVIQNQEEVAFIQSIAEGAQLLWIGLKATFPERKWTWLDGSPFNDKLFQELGPVEENFCGRLNGNQIISEECNTITTWVCETAALLI
ncbi:killer cell lectin-like receptor subfamily B member 1B allele A [Sphaerodactylus townsendi]|uniref:killer cell lectin-like receptor subfamily B member 1B allele A n=1 Tax=Sphaerodactylus townsendi TaxID=933632 RepID=UPI002026AF27|nr:killer cell lectin-like receptor subfamily B member 1B allele A [Sphaerodactylus townsendi]